MKLQQIAVACGALAVAVPALAAEFEYGGASFVWNNRFSVGGAWRMEDRDPNLVAKLNVNPNLCDGDDCLSLSGDPGPNQRLVDAPGSFSGNNGDNGNLNYNKNDMVAAAAKLYTDLSMTWNDVSAKVRGYGFYDHINSNAKDFHPDTRFQPAYTDRPVSSDRLMGQRLMLLDAFVSLPVEVGDQTFNISAGEQRIRWGEANFIALNTINDLNPPDQNLLYLPGSQISEIFLPVGVVSISTAITDSLSLEALYQYEWKRARVVATSSFWSESDAAGGGKYAVITLGQTSEDPNRIGTLQGAAGLITNTSTTIRLEPEDFGFPQDGGQFGLRLSGYSEFNGGTEWGTYFLNYHSRLPLASAYATDESCARNATTVVDATASCLGFSGTLNPTGLGKEPIPFDTMRLFLEYPEDIQLYGASFNTNLGTWSLAGEAVYRPNLPVQVHLPDVIMAAAQPALPRRDINAVIGTIPNPRRFIPDFVETRYRGHDVQANQYIPGYERLEVGQIDITGIKSISSSNPFKADQILIIAEVGAMQFFNMPDKSEIQFEAGDAQETHASPGADGTGSGGVPDASRLNPTQQTSGFADEFSWGVRSIVRFEYNGLIAGTVLRPTFIFGHDVDGNSPLPVQNFIEGRTQFQVGAEMEFTQALSGTAFYQGYTGGGSVNKLHDRDFVSASLAYNF